MLQKVERFVSSSSSIMRNYPFYLSLHFYYYLG
jgi:hypothetical protein